MESTAKERVELGSTFEQAQRSELSKVTLCVTYEG